MGKEVLRDRDEGTKNLENGMGAAKLRSQRRVVTLVLPPRLVYCAEGAPHTVKPPLQILLELFTE